MSDRVYRINLDESIIKSFDEAVDAEKHISMQKEFSQKKYRGICAWDCICTCISRIRDTVGYLNDMELGSMRHGNAFDFMEFVNCASIVINSVSMLAKIFQVDLSAEDSRSSIFNQTGSDGKGTDKKYFEYVRSLCVVHPMETSRHREYQGTEFVTCAFIAWTNSLGRTFYGDCDLHANAFVNDANSWGNDINLYINQIFEYVEYRYELLNKVADELVRYQESVIDSFRACPVKPQKEDEPFVTYLARLKEEEHGRFGDGNSFIFDFAIDVLNFRPSNPDNRALVDRYKNAWKFAIELERSALCNVTHHGRENAGIDDETGWTLFEHLVECDANHPSLQAYDYHLEKLHFLDGKHPENEAEWGRQKFGEMRHVFDKRVALDDCVDDHELYLLACAALYEMALEVPGPIDDAIPRTAEFRKCLDNSGVD